MEHGYFAYECVINAHNAIIHASYFPFRTGNLKWNGTKITHGENEASVLFDTNLVPYITYLEEGTKPHDIPNAFGLGEDFGIGGRFEGFFHPGSKKHMGFISRDSVRTALDCVYAKCEKNYIIIGTSHNWR